MRKTITLQNARAFVLASLCGLCVIAPELALAQEAATPTTPPASGSPSGPAASAPAPAGPAAPESSATATPDDTGATGADAPASAGETPAPSSEGTPVTPTAPTAAEPTAPAGYVEPATPSPPSSEDATMGAMGVAEAAPAPEIDETLVTEPKSKVPSYVMWSIGGASLIAGSVLGISALAAKSDFDKMPTYDAADRVEFRTTAADVAFGLSIVMLVTGTAFYFMPGSTEPRPIASNHPKRATARLHVAPLLGRTTGGALSLQF